MAKNVPELGVQIPNILLPKKWINLEKRAVVACDQYTSEPEYRQEVSNIVNDEPSTFNITFPEVYLEDEDKPQRIENIQAYMSKYLESGILEDQGEGLILVDRKTSHAESRKWLMIALDLESYDYSKESQTLIRATEGTVIDRLPPRIQIRKDASIELPHIMVLIDDENRTVIEPLFAQKDKYEQVYDTDLMMNGGHITGYKINDETSINQVLTALKNLGQKDVFQKKYNVGDDKGVLLFAMGDGNHSLATAKAIWEQKKLTLNDEQRANDAARFALVELVNVHDTGLAFEPIHRVLFNVDAKHLLEEFKTFADINIQTFASMADMKANTPTSNADHHYINFVYDTTYGIITINHPQFNLEVGNLQAFLDSYLKANSDAKIDYVHGEETTEKLWSQAWNMGFWLPIMDKNDFFKTVVIDGVLPRKTFSMGEAEEKRFYLEARKIK